MFEYEKFQGEYSALTAMKALREIILQLFKAKFFQHGRSYPKEIEFFTPFRSYKTACHVEIRKCQEILMDIIDCDGSKEEFMTEFMRSIVTDMFQRSVDSFKFIIKKVTDEPFNEPDWDFYEATRSPWSADELIYEEDIEILLNQLPLHIKK
jgi:hypothetical protein